MWAAYALEYTSIYVGKQLALVAVWWERSEELLRSEIWLAIEEDRLDDAATLIEMNRGYGYPHNNEWDAEVARRSTFFYAAKRAPEDIYRGLAYGEMENAVSTSVAITSDFFVIGDFRDLANQAYQVSQGEELDKLVTGLAAIGIVTTFGTPIVDGGVSLAKAAARQTAKQSAGFRRLLSSKVTSAVDFAELKRVLKGSEFSPSGMERLSHGIKRALHFERVSDFFSDLGVIVRNSGGVQNSLFLVKKVSDADSLKAVKRASAGLGDKTALMVRLGGERVIKVFGRLFQKLLWLIGAILGSLLSILQILILIVLGRWSGGGGAKISAATN
ncbi:hypothetical protein GCM10027567_00870 [Spongiibacter taiwanensis]